MLLQLAEIEELYSILHNVDWLINLLLMFSTLLILIENGSYPHNREYQVCTSRESHQDV